MPLVGSRVKRLTEFTMRRDFELGDSVGPYRKSLLYLISRSFEDQSEMPILGLEESIRRDPDLVRFFGLLGNKAGRGEILFSTQEDGPSKSTIAKNHGDFDNDRLTMSGVIRRILRIADNDPITEFPETVSRNILDIVATPVRPAPTVLTAVPVATIAAPTLVPAASGRRRAVCVGIDQYAPPNALAGCVNDANDWAAALRGFGFDVSVMTNQDATWKGLNDVLTGLVSSARPGDVLVFQYAGHGTLVDDLDGDENGNRDSALCPVDFMSGGFLIDDDIRRIFGGLQDGVSLTCFFDCCHSGTITRLAAPGPTRVGGDVRRRFLNATPEMLAAHRRFRQSLSLAAAPGRSPLTMKEVSFTACTDAQTAQEVDGHGQFTVRAMSVLSRGLSGLTNEEFHTRVVAAFGSGLDAQTPQLDCAAIARTRALLGGLSGGAPTTVAADLSTIVARLNGIDRRLATLGV
jgi:Caspase domain